VTVTAVGVVEVQVCRAMMEVGVVVSVAAWEAVERVQGEAREAVTSTPPEPLQIVTLSGAARLDGSVTVPTAGRGVELVNEEMVKGLRLVQTIPAARVSGTRTQQNHWIQQNHCCL